MSRGRPRKPTAQKKREGTYRKDRANREPEPAALDGVPPPPPWLTDEARKVWSERAPEAHRMGCLTTADLEMFGLFCQAAGDFRELSRRMRRPSEDFVTFNRDARPFLNALVTARDKAARTMMQLSGRFGLTPADRARIDMAPPADSEKERKLGILKAM